MTIYVPGELERFAREEPILFEAICLMEGLARLGFGEGAFRPGVSPVSVFVGPTADRAKALFAERNFETADLGLFVSLEDGRGLRWNGLIGPIPYSAEEFKKRWLVGMSAFAHAPPDEAERAWESSLARFRLDGLRTVLRNKGFVVPWTAAQIDEMVLS